MTVFTIERSTLEDIEILRKVGKETFFETFYDSNTEENMDDYLRTSFSYENVKGELENRDSIFFIARYKDQVAGYMKVNFERAQTEVDYKNSLEVQRIYILKKYQRMGLGKIFIDRSIEIAKEKDLDYIWLGVWENNINSIKFYEKQGFKKFDTHSFLVGEDRDRKSVV